MLDDKMFLEKYSRGYVGVAYFIAISSVAFYYFAKQEYIADYDSYLSIIDRTYYFYDFSQIYYEPASTVILYLSRIIAGSSVEAVMLARVFTTFVLIFSIYYFGKYRKVPTTALVATVALFGPLLAFVTIRATPAYMLIALAAIDANHGRRRSIIWAVLAVQFHISAILAVPPIVLNLIQNRTKIFNFLERSVKGIIISLVLVGILFIVFGSALSDALVQSVGQVGFLIKYVAYVGVLDSTNAPAAVANSDSRLYHQLYLAFTTLFFGILLISKSLNCIRFRTYLISSFAIYIFMQFSPVTAFRYSLYWVIPGLFLFPWYQYVRGEFLRMLALIVCLGIFVLQINSVIE